MSTPQDTPQERIKNALIFLANNCDGAYKEDGVGFNSYDAKLGHSLTTQIQAGNGLSSEQETAALKMLQKYRRQLEHGGIDLPQPQQEQEKERVAILEGNAVIFQISRDDVRTRQEIKALQKRSWDYDSKAWRAPLDQNDESLDKLLEILESFDDTDEIFAAIETAREENKNKPNGFIDLFGSNLFAVTFGYDPKLVTAVKQLSGRKWNSDKKMWTVPLASHAEIVTFAEQYNFGISNEAQTTIQEQGEKGEVLANGSRAVSAKLEIKGLGGTLKPFQAAGVVYALQSKRLIIGDEMGLGKTVEALATIQAANSYPAIVVCPACVKINWYREASKWLPGKSVTVLNGGPTTNGNENLNLGDYDVVIINYDILSRWLKRLQAIGWKVAILDESHYIKNYKTKRTESATKLLENIEYRLLLTGTPILNRPKELIAQLGALGQLDELGGFWDFVKQYCGAYRDRWGWNIDGATNLDELNEKMRAICFVRRKKSEVCLELPEKRRAVIPVSISNRRQYNKARNDLVAYIRETEGDQAARKASYAEHLVEIEKLKQLAVAGKMKAITEWIESFLESGEKLVVFAWHKDVVKQLAEQFDAPYITGEVSTSKRQEIIDAFQNNDDCNLVVCNIKAAGVGITLTAASNVAFVELGWTPADHDQAEDRCHRIGQENSVTAWYLLAEDTIEETIATLLDQKRIVVNAATDGKNIEETDMITEIFENLKEERK